MTATTDTPGGTVEHFSALLGEGRLDALLELYDEDATFVPEPGRVVSGRARSARSSSSSSRWIRA